MIEVPPDALEIAHPVAVRIRERARIDLVDDPGTPPRLDRHRLLATAIRPAMLDRMGDRRAGQSTPRTLRAAALRPHRARARRPGRAGAARGAGGRPRPPGSRRDAIVG